MRQKTNWPDLRYTPKTLANNRKRFFTYASFILYCLHGVGMTTLLLLDQHKWALVCEGTMLCYGLLVLLAPDSISRDVSGNIVHYGGVVMPLVYIVMVGLLV